MIGALTIHPKVTAAGLSGAVMTLVVYVLHQFLGVDLPAEVAAALAVVIMFAAGWLAPGATEVPADAQGPATPSP